MTSWKESGSVPENHEEKREDMQPSREKFWESKSLDEMNDAEWEALCDGCGKCCLVVLIDEDDDTIHETDVSCRLYNPETRQCRDYQNRHQQVADCVRLTPELSKNLEWMPSTCAYRRLAHGQKLAEWHPLISGTRQSVVEAGIATSKSLLSEEDIKMQDLPGRVRAQRI